VVVGKEGVSGQVDGEIMEANGYFKYLCCCFSENGGPQDVKLGAGVKLKTFGVI